MRFYATLPFVIGAASATQMQQLRSSGTLEAGGITQVVASKSAKARKVANLLSSLKKGRNLQAGDGAIPELYEGEDSAFDFDFGDMDLGDLGLEGLGLCDGEEMELFNVECTCSLRKMDDTRLESIGDIMSEFSSILDEGFKMGFSCNTVEPECVGNECGKMIASCDMTMDFNDLPGNSFDCDTCIEYTDPQGKDGIMAGNTLCMDMDLCVPDLMAEKAAGDGLGFDVSDILCGCSATLKNNNGKKNCSCGICGDISEGVKLSCSLPGEKETVIESTCADTGFEMLNPNDASSLASATQLLPQFAVVDDSDSSSAYSPSAAITLFTSAMSLVLLSSIA